MSNFKKMMLVDYNEDAAHERGVEFSPSLPSTSQSNQQKIFNIRSRFVASDHLQMIDLKLQKIEMQMRKLIKNKKINNDDKLMYITGLIKKYGDLKALRRSEIEKSDANFIEKIKNSVPPQPATTRDEKRKKNSLIKDKIAEITSILKNTPMNKTPLQRPTIERLNRDMSENLPEDDLIIPKSLFQNDDDDDEDNNGDESDGESVYEDVLEDRDEELEPMNISKVKGLKRRYSTPIPSVGRRKRFRSTVKKINKIKAWELRPTEARKLKWELAELKRQLDAEEQAKMEVE
jgi:hypothetical protein